MAATPGLPPNFLTTLKQKMHSTEGIVCFLEELDPLWLFTCPMEQILNELLGLTTPFDHCLELILSGGLWADILSEWLMRNFPREPSSNLPSSLHVVILRRLLDCVYLNAPSGAPGLKSSTMADRTRVRHILQVVETLSRMDFHSRVPDDSGQSKEKLSSTRRRPSQAERKHDTKKQRIPADHDNIAFDLLDLTRPRSVEGTQEMLLLLAVKLQELLNQYVKILQSDDIATSLRESFVLGETSPLQPSFDNRSRAKSRHASTIAPDMGIHNSSTSSTLAFARPLKASLYFDSALGFGQWEILVNNEAIRKLRITYKQNRPLHDAIMRKMKDLSNGHFSGNNPLNKGEDTVPVFEAKMNYGMRIIYQIDCISEYCESQKRERQGH